MDGSKLIVNYINKNIEDYILKKKNEGYEIPTNNNKLEVLGLIVSLVIYVVISYLMFDANKLEEIISEDVGLWEIYFPLVFYMLKVFLAPIPVIILFVLLYTLLLKVGEIVYGFSLEDTYKETINETSLEYGYKLKMLEELCKPLYIEVSKGGITNWEDEVVLQDIDEGFKKLINRLNSVVELPNGYITRQYEIIKIEEEYFVLSSDFKEVDCDKMTEVSKLTEEDVIEWYSNLLQLTNSLYELKSLDEVYQSIKDGEEKRVSYLTNIEDIKLKESSIIKQKQDNSYKRDKSLSMLGKHQVIQDLKEEIDKVNKDSVEVNTRTKELLNKVEGK